MERTIATNEIAAIASDCLRCIRADEDVIVMLAAKGFSNPKETWYSIRRWIKSNRPADYVVLPPKWKVELPVQKVPVTDKFGTHTVKLYGEEKPEEREDEKPEEPESEKEETRPAANATEGFEVVTPKRRGRPKGWKKPAEEEAKADPVVSETPKIRIRKLESERFSFSREDDGKISINKRGASNYLTINEEEAKELAKTIPIVVGMLKS